VRQRLDALLDRFRALGNAYRFTRGFDPRLDLWMALAIGIPTIGGIVIGVVTGMWVLWPITGLLLGLLVAMLIFGRRVQAAQFSSLEGIAGGAAAVLDQMRGQWFVTPAVGATKQQEMVHRAVGRCGIVLVTAGGTGPRVKALVQRERKKLARVAGDAPVHVVMTGDGEGDTVPLTKLQTRLARFSNELDKTEVPKLARRLAPLDKGNIPMPKGYVPRGRPR
jgi:hypothetical protein